MISQYECFCIKPVHESRITIQGIPGLLSFMDDCVIHEFAHAFGAHLGREDDILDEGSAILQEVFPFYTEIVMERYYRRQRKGQNSPLMVGVTGHLIVCWWKQSILPFDI